ncbi:hypothetical protein DB354_18500 [Opitutus sp. ER46]|nr:hypothetical protein DB354_18500 [Opitutus sp. ER46]
MALTASALAQESVPAVPTQPATLPATVSATPPLAPGENPVLATPATPTTPAPRPRRARAISPEVAAQLAAASPKYAPPAPKPATPSAEEEDLRETDKPRNGIIRLPKYIVTQPRPPVFSERAITTDKGLADIAMKRYLNETYRALNAFTLPLFGASKEQVAMSMYEEDERLRNMADMSDLARMVTATDKAAGLYVKREVQETFVREGNFDWRPLSRR